MHIEETLRTVRMSRKFKAKGSKKTIPISLRQFEFITETLEDRCDFRMVVAVHLMYRCARVGDLLKNIRIGDIYNSDGTIKDRIEFNEQKTGKYRVIPIRGERFVNALKEYYEEIKYCPPTETLFYNKKRKEPLTVSGIKYVLSGFVGQRGIEQCSPHSLRKGGSRHMWESGVRIEAISNVLNHHSTRVTEIYIAITPQDIEQSMECLAI